MKEKISNVFKRIFEKLKSVDKQVYKKIFILIVIPILIYLYTQLFCNGKIIFERKRMLLNFMFIYFLIGFFYSIFGKSKVSLFITVILTCVVGFINHFITAFRGTPLVPWDIFSVNVALSVLPTFRFTITKKLVLGMILFALSIFLLIKVKFESFHNNKFKIIYRISVLIIVVAFTICFYLTNMVKWFELDENWDPKEEYHNNGLIVSLFKQSRNLIIHTPEGYDVNSLYELAKTIEVPIVEHDETYEYPNIIVIMNESFSDLQVVGKFKTNTDYLSYLKA